MSFLKLIRYKNLLIIIATMLIARYALVGLFMPLQFSLFGFVMLVTATVCITGAGYIINDYFDVNADMMNKPNKVIIGKEINRRTAMIYHWTLNILGCICGIIASLEIGKPSYSFIFLFITGILWFYATTFSKEPLLGNAVVAILVALVPLIEVLYELFPILSMPIEDLRMLRIDVMSIIYWSFGYAIFAFLLTLQREMVKDIEDVEGDRTYGRNTMPIAWGLKTARLITIFVSLLVFILLAIIQYCQLNDWYSLFYINVGITLPLIYALLRFIKADSAEDYGHVSLVLKLVMLMGLLYLVPLILK